MLFGVDREQTIFGSRQVSALKKNASSTVPVISVSKKKRSKVEVVKHYWIFIGAWSPYIEVMVDVAVPFPLAVTKHGNSKK